MSDRVMDLRAEMMAEGWSSCDRVTQQGWGPTPGYSVWFERWDWHGRRTLLLIGNKAVYHAHRPSLDQIFDAVLEASDRARRAWTDFPDCPPSQGGRNELIEQTPLLPK